MEKTKKRKPLSPKTKKRIAIILSCVLGGVLLFFALLYFVVGGVFFEFALDATFPAVQNAPSGFDVNMPVPFSDEEWLGEIDKELVEITSGDSYKLKAYKILNATPTDNWVITFHGYRGKSLEMGFYAHKFYDEGFNVLMPDLKGHGQSEGKYVGMGFGDRFEVIDWANYIINDNSNAKIVLHGVSMGAATIMCAVGETLPENIVCAIEDCGFSSAYKQFQYVLEYVLKLPFRRFIMSASNFIARLRLGKSLTEYDCVKQLKKSKTPMLFIHGGADTFVPASMLDEVFGANPNIEKEKLVVEGATHAYSATQDSELYFKTVFDFVHKYL